MEGIRMILSLPRARRLVAEGGILWRIALCWGSPSLYNECLYGPSALALHYRVGETHPERELFDDGLSSQTLSIVLGVQDNNRSMWPHPDLLEYSQQWYGIWTESLEVWFQKRVQEIISGQAKPLSVSEWRKTFETFRRWERHNVETVGSEPHAQHVCNRLDTEFPEMWKEWTKPYEIVLRDAVSCPFKAESD
ncbi:hypothetical protein BDN72DRAFT_903987 [Pluteus cervinus]|uniref:Uncharacterized protein n=1 Tax=Pluteus cervinus TaxID=181527 RepID=A0ACD3A9R4_9AGAR|nr:hypothetical protein BDN72DRAFT_903987 [Pluteus cervinus]